MKSNEKCRCGVRVLSLTAALACGLLVAPSLADTLRVPQDYTTIQAGINAAQNGDEVVIDDGTWAGTGNVDLQLNGKAITVRSLNRDPRACIIDCSGTSRAFHVESGEGPDTIISGFMIRRGDAGETGGAVRILSSSPSIRNCIFEANEAEFHGGAIYADTDSRPTIVRCLFLRNSASLWGGAIFFGTRSHADLIDCAFSGNFAGNGGAVGIWASQVQIVNCTFHANGAVQDGGAIYAGEGGVPNSALIQNCIVWENNPSNLAHQIGAAPNVRYSNVGGGWPGPANIDADPMFVDPAGPDGTFGTLDDDLRLRNGSPSIDTGTGLMLEFERDADAWKQRAGGWEAYAFDEFLPGIVDGAGCLANSGVELSFDGGDVVFRHIDDEGFGDEQSCAVTDGSTPAGQVSDGNLTSVDGAMVMEFDPPITAFCSYYAAQDVNTDGRMRLWSGDRVVDVIIGPISSHSTWAIGHGFTSRLPIDRVDFISYDNNQGSGVLMGAYVGVVPGDARLGTVQIDGYQGPNGATVDLDFGMTFDNGSGQMDLDGNPRATDGDDDGVAWIDMGAYEAGTPGGSAGGEKAGIKRLDVRKGDLVSGGIPELKRDDQQWVKIDSHFDQGSAQPHIVLTEVMLKSHVENPERITVTLDSRLDQPGGSGAIRLWNFNTRRWIEVKSFSIGANDRTITARNLPAAKYVNEQGRIKVRILHSMVTPQGGRFRSFLDLLRVKVR